MPLSRKGGCKGSSFLRLAQTFSFFFKNICEADEAK